MEELSTLPELRKAKVEVREYSFEKGAELLKKIKNRGKKEASNGLGET